MNTRFAQAVGSAAWLLRDAADDGRCRVVMVCGISPSSGCSSLTVALARELREAHRLRPLVVELSANGHGLARYLDLDASRTVQDIGGGERCPCECVQHDSTGVAVIPSKGGKTAPQWARDELTGALRSIVKELSASYDFVLLDAPPATSVESIAAVAVAPQVLLVAEYGRTDNRAIARAKAEIERAGGTVIGAILTKQRPVIPRWLDRLLGA